MREENEQLDIASTEYWAVVTGGVFDFLVNSWSVWHGKDSNFYRQEKDNLQKYVKPVYIGVGTGIFVFANFRVTGSRGFQAWRKQWQSQVKGHAPDLKTTQQQDTHWMSHLERQRNDKEKAALQSVKLLTDLLVSLSVGTSASLLLLDAEKQTLRKDFEDGPRVCGRSLFADSICPGMINVAEKYPLNSQAYTNRVNLQTFSKVVSNCRLRGRAENKVRERFGKHRGEPVSVPYPGL